MDQGLITSPKDLEHMQAELESLQRRMTSLEDDELEVMARLEDAQQELDSLTAQVAAADERLAALSSAVTPGPSSWTRTSEQIATDRGPAAAALPEDLLALYDRLRASKNSVGVGALRARECGGCGSPSTRPSSPPSGPRRPTR